MAKPDAVSEAWRTYTSYRYQVIDKYMLLFISALDDHVFEVMFETYF